MDVYNRRPQGEGAECRGRERAPGFSNLGRDPDLPSCRQLPSMTLSHLDIPSSNDGLSIYLRKSGISV